MNVYLRKRKKSRNHVRHTSTLVRGLLCCWANRPSSVGAGLCKGDGWEREVAFNELVVLAVEGLMCGSSWT